MGRENAFFSVRKRSFSCSISPSKGADFQSSGKSSRRARGSTTAPERAWLLISLPFSRTAIESSHAALLGQAGEVVGPCQAGRSGAHEENVDLQGFALIAHACDLLDPVQRIHLEHGCYHGPRALGCHSFVLQVRRDLRPTFAGKAHPLRAAFPAPGARGSCPPDLRRGRPYRPDARPKVLYPKYFYDELGSRLFEAICALPEYYLTRAEAGDPARARRRDRGLPQGPVRPVR